jgi:polysaccharide chain length determinant protein (PEP-CTERM system associated)
MNSLYDEIKVALHSVWKRRWLALLVAWGVCLLGWLFVSMMPNRYESEAKVSVETTSLPGAVENDRKKKIDNVKRTLNSTINLEQVVRGTDLVTQTANNKEITNTALGLQKNIKIEDGAADNIFKISARIGLSGNSDAENAKLSRDIVQKIIDIYTKQVLTGGSKGDANTLAMLDQQVTQRQALLDEAEKRRVKFETENLGSLGSDQSGRDRAMMELSQLESTLIQAQSALSAINGQLISTPPTIKGQPTIIPGTGGPIGPSRAQVLEGEVATRAAQGWTESHPDMIALRKQLEIARRAGNGPGPEGPKTIPGQDLPNPIYSQLQMQRADRAAAVEAASQRKMMLQAQLSNLSSGRMSEPAIQAEQQRLAKESDTLKTQFTELVNKREAIRLGSQTGGAMITVLDSPSYPKGPVAPDRAMMLSGILILGLLAGVGAAFAKSQVQTGYVTSQRLAKASGIPVLGAITELLKPEARRAAAKKLKMFYVGAAALAGVFVLLHFVETYRLSGMA